MSGNVVPMVLGTIFGWALGGALLYWWLRRG